MPGTYTASLTGTEDFTTDGDWYLNIIDKYWQWDQPNFKLDDSQRWLIRHALERYPDDWHDPELAGRLRFREVVISMGRQNGKSVLGTLFGVYGLLFHEHNPYVIGVAFSAQTASIIYKRVSSIINATPVFRKKCIVTATRGIRRTDGSGEYLIKPNNEKAVQGFPMSMCLYDEVHITKAALWDAALQGIKTRADGMIMGITTAGDDNSELLKRLYKRGEAAVATGTDERFGFFLWQAPEGATLDTPGAIEAANPAVAEGRIPVSRARQDAKDMSYVDVQRYVLNRFVASVNPWVETGAWLAVVGEGLTPDLAARNDVVYGIDASAGLEYVSITANAKVDGKVYSTVIATQYRMTQESLWELCKKLKRPWVTFAFDSLNLKFLHAEMERAGWTHYSLSTNETATAWSTVYAMVVSGRVEVAGKGRGPSMLASQVFRGKRKNFGDTWRVSRVESGMELDALFATVMGVYIAETMRVKVPQLFV